MSVRTIIGLLLIFAVPPTVGAEINVAELERLARKYQFDSTRNEQGRALADELCSGLKLEGGDKRNAVINSLPREAGYFLTRNAIVKEECSYLSYQQLKLAASQSANGGDIRGMTLLGQLIMDNELDKEDLSVQILEIAARHGDAQAAGYLGNYYLFRAKKINAKEGVRYLKYAAESGHSFSMFNLARIYLQGKVVEKNEDFALKMLFGVADSELSDDLKKTLIIGLDICSRRSQKTTFRSCESR